jgi:hypothetical protein
MLCSTEKILQQKQTNAMIDDGSVLSPTASALETRQTGAWPTSRAAAALRSNSKKSTLYLHYFISLGKHILVEK